VRLLFVALAGSSHTASWMSQLKDQNWDVHIFSPEDGSLHPELSEVTVHGLWRQRSSEVHPSIRQTGLAWPFRRGRTRVTRLLHGLSRYMSPASMLARTIRELKPTILHTLEMQRAGYLTLEAREEVGADVFPPWIFSCWGNDIYLFGRRPEHEARVRQVLRSCDFFIADCHRDVALARQFGFRGRELGVFPTVGGYDISRMQEWRQGLPAQRRLIMIKGYQSDTWGGRALVALQALRLCAGALSGYRIIVYAAYPESQVGLLAKEVSHATGLDISVLSPRPRDEILRLFGQARVAIGLSVSDGTPNTMLEAMIMGAFPVQSDTVSTGEWIGDGQNGFLVPPENAAAVADAIQKAVEDDPLVNQAADLNDRITRDRVEMSIVQPQVIEMYRRVAAWQRPRDASERLVQAAEGETEVGALCR